ncbi:hypothetical protein SAMN05216223_115134 [Actinacidiphila yanglinensis]|uniref:Uncharacterized protein n=1 Tax=Actinacidiphila yanglinensis TaxID=310779 RepID=A0A1H6DH64_9ACTN|nr:hypothetical protein [Actinacidiphila yanglinensis]SEG84787.1 hypothetical protein SAMN05216223_115134 [Actinacidiphila yanglinensis]
MPSSTTNSLRAQARYRGTEPPEPAHRAWHSLESNQVGLDEFARWLELTDSELMPAVDVATRGILPGALSIELPRVSWTALALR